MSSSKILADKDIQPSTLSFGFLGLGIMGSGIVKNLINSGKIKSYIRIVPRNIKINNFQYDKHQSFPQSLDRMTALSSAQHQSDCFS
jgi:pyrroline-5-carboxylate reductase